MKALLRNFLCLAALATLFASCSKDEDTPSVTKHPLKEILFNQYWVEDLRFVYVEDGETRISEKNIFYDYGWSGGHPCVDQVALGVFSIKTDWIHNGFVSRECYSLRQYDNNSSDYKPGFPYTYDDDRYRIYIDEERQMVYVEGNSPELVAMNAVSGSYMKVREVTDKQVVFDAPIKSFIRDWWVLEGSSKRFPKREYIGLRVTWSKFRWPEVLDEATPLDRKDYPLNSASK